MLRLEDNDLEIVCVKGSITVTLNGETINRCTVSGGEVDTEKFSRGMIGLQKSDGVTFTELNVRALLSPSQSGGTQGQIQRWIVLPLFVAAFLGTFAFCFGDLPGARGVKVMPEWLSPAPATIVPWSWTTSAVVTGGITAALLFLIRLGVVASGWVRVAAGTPKRRRASWRLLATILREAFFLGLASAIGGVCVRGLYQLFRGGTLWEVTVWGTPALICLSMLVLTLHIGLLGRALPDEVREWWSRLGAWLLIYSLLWAGLFGIAFYASPLFHYADSRIPKANWVTCVGWLLTTIGGVFAARSPRTGDSTKSSRLREIFAQIAPYIFIIGLFLFLSLGIDLLVTWIASPEHLSAPPTEPGLLLLLRNHWARMDVSNNWFSVGTLAAGAIVVTAILSWRLDINQFSMHLLYRNRLGGAISEQRIDFGGLSLLQDSPPPTISNCGNCRI